jgi:hypothetical protein
MTTISATKCGSGFPAAMIEAESLSHKIQILPKAGTFETK